ncbi:MAG TPA: ATP synthase F1 subunit gamma [Candidatus Humimicrobiaceae bacterium]
MEKSQEIRSRIKSITGTRKITKAMEMIASSKIRKAQKRILEARAFVSGIEGVIVDIAQHSKTITDPLLAKHDNNNTVLVIGITADRGLCGGYNSNIIRLTEKTIKQNRDKGKDVKIDIAGTRGRNFFRYMGYKIDNVYENLSDYPRFLDAREISREIIRRYVSGEVDRVIICYTKFKNPAEQVPSRLQLLPLEFMDSGIHLLQDELPSIKNKKTDPSEGTGISKSDEEFLYDPSQDDVLSAILPEYIYTIVYGALLESTASETGARMTAMKSASDNAEDMIKELVLLYHRARQQQITMEIAEIVSGANALSEGVV